MTKALTPRTLSLQTVWPTQWLRGPAHVRAGMVELDRERSTQYVVHPDPERPLRLASIRSRDDVLRFAATDGLLRTGPGAAKPAEDLKGVQSEAKQMAQVLRLHANVRDVLAGVPGALERLRTWDAYLRKAYRSLEPEGFAPPPFMRPGRNPTDVELTPFAMIGLEWLVNCGLEGTESRILAVTGDSPRFEDFGQPQDLLAYAYFDLKALVIRRVPVTTCEECGRFFEVDDPRKRFCSTRCGTRARHRRWRKPGEKESARGKTHVKGAAR